MKREAILFFFGCSEVNIICLITSELANQRARKVLVITCVLYTNKHYSLPKDVLQYFTNLTEANIRDKPEWKLEYRASSSYGIPDVSTASMQKLVESFASVNSENFAKYYKFNSVSLNQNCDAKCKKGQVCSITKVDFDGLDICLTSSSTSTTSSSTTSSPTTSSSTMATSSKALSQRSFKHLTGFPFLFALFYHFIFQ